jgi:ATP-binding cassette subfamily B multidrug efflux pump
MWQQLKTVRKYLWRYRGGMALGLLCLVLKDAAQTAQPLMIRGAVDALGKPAGGFLRFAGFLVALAAAKSVLQYWMRVILIGISRDIEYDLRNDLFRHLTALSPEYYGRTRTGDIMARVTNDLNAVRMMLGPGIMYWMETSLTFAFAMAVMFSTDWRLALFAMSPAPLVSLSVILFGRVIHARFERIQALFSDISSRVQENLSGVRMIRAFAQETSEMRRFEELNKRYIAQNLGLVRIQGFFEPFLEALIGVTVLMVLWVGGRQALEGHISIGGFVMFNAYMGMLAWPMIALGWVVNLMQRGVASLKRINEILREKPGIAAPERPAPLASVAGEIGFRGVSVSYNGSGKSTLASLIPRLMDPTEGAVTLDGIDLRRFDPGELRRHIGFVPQETFLFSATLAENIAFGVDGATHETIRRAAEMAGLAADIEGFPMGLDTVVGERGITLSGGQKQRTAIARALLRDPRILILDDALSSVDTLTEERILNHLAGIMKGRTVILISHRVSTVREADSIVALENGRIAQQGTHAELIEAGGYYADLSHRQMLEEELEAI